MSKQIYFLVAILFFLTLSSSAQEYTYIDFSNTNTTTGNWNNLISTTVSQTGLSISLINDAGTSTGATLTVTDTFNQINENGTTSPTNTIFPSTATRDSFFGNFGTWNSVIETTGGMEFTGLNPTKYYSFKVFASRTGVSDNREALYTFTGANTLSGTLDASNNTGNTADVFNVQPDGSGKITLAVTKGPNNTNGTGFYYLGAIQMITTTTPYSENTDPEISLVYPNGGEIWHATSTPEIRWESAYLTSDVVIEYSLDNGVTWNYLTSVNETETEFEWNIPYVESTQCKVRVTSGTVNDTSENPFSLIANTDHRFKIVVLGSSTAAGAGPSSVNNAWVWMYTDYLTQMDTRFDVTNLAVGGYTTYDILPTGTPIPGGVSETIDINRNITKAIALNADGVIVNMPSNDSNMGYPVVDQMANYNLIQTTSINAGIPIWICNVQPRNFAIGSNAMNIQLQMSTEIPSGFPSNNIDFWTGIANADGTVNSLYNSGDGVHLNDAGHLVLLARVIGSGLHNTVRTGDDGDANAVLNGKNYLIDINYNASLHLTSGNWNNLSDHAAGSITGLVDDLGAASSINVAVSDAFSQSNEVGVLTPTGTHPFPSSAVRDAFYGDNANPTAALTFTGLNPEKIYTFEIIGSRKEMSDNRETLYTAVGATTSSAALNASSNSANTCIISDIEPDSSNQIVLNMAKGPNNNNGSNYYYINAVKLMEEDPILPDVLLDAENGTTNRLTVLNPMANGPGQSSADFVVVNNPLVAGINTSSKVVMFTRRTTGADTEPWGGFWCNAIDPDPDVTVNKYVHVKILKNRTSQQKFKLETGSAGNLEIFSTNSYTDVGQWQDMVFDFSSKTGTYTTVALMPDWQDPLVEGAVEIIYFDDIVINTDPNPEVLGVNTSILQNQVRFFPNPSTNLINLETQQALQTVNLYSMDGHLSKQFSNMEIGVHVLDVELLKTGIYFIQFISTEGATFTTKFIKE